MKRLNIRCLRGLKAVGIEIADKLPKPVAKFSRRRSGFRLMGQKAGMVRSLIVNKILSFQYHLGRLIGRKRAGHICVLIERGFTTVFGREVYCDGK